MSNSHSVTCWIDKLREGDPRAAQAIWQRYFGRLVQLAHQKLQGFPRRAARPRPSQPWVHLPSTFQAPPEWNPR